MHPVTHLLAGWIVADECKLKGRDRALVAWSCVVPDLDGIGYAIDFANKAFGRPETTYYELYHHDWCHGLPAAILLTIIVSFFAIDKHKTTMLAFLTFHLHLLMDLAASRGSNPLDIWPVYYLSPFSEKLTFIWSGQWPLTGWQNTTLTIILMLYCCYIAIKKNYSPVSLFNKHADLVFVRVLQDRFKR
jgi:hypothetical protein